MPMEDHLRPWDQADFDRKFAAFKKDYDSDPFFKKPVGERTMPQSPVGHTSSDAPTHKFDKWLYPTREQHQAAIEDVQMRGEDIPPGGNEPVIRENAAAKANREFQRSFGPKRPENVAGAKSLDMRHGNAAHGVGALGGRKNQAAIDLGGDLRTGRRLMQSGATLGADLPPMVKNIPALQYMGAAPMPSNVMETYREANNPNLNWQDKMIRFLGRAGGLSTDNPDMI